ncbi:MAG: SRPBCC family protein [Deltaproteobacteria bacterium]
MIEVTVSTEIAAPAATVWKILTELDQFAAWNPFIEVAHGDLRPGGTVHVRVQTGLGIAMRFSAKVLDFSSGRELHWRGQVGSRFLACG